MIQCCCCWWNEKRSKNWLHTIIIISCCARNESSCFILILLELKITIIIIINTIKSILHFIPTCVHWVLGIVYQTYPADPSFLTNLIKTIAFIIHSQTSFSMGMANKKWKKQIGNERSKIRTKTMASKYWRKDENKPEIRNNKKIIERKINERKKQKKNKQMLWNRCLQAFIEGHPYWYDY